MGQQKLYIFHLLIPSDNIKIMKPYRTQFDFHDPTGLPVTSLSIPGSAGYIHMLIIFIFRIITSAPC